MGDNSAFFRRDEFSTDFRRGCNGFRKRLDRRPRVVDRRTVDEMTSSSSSTKTNVGVSRLAMLLLFSVSTLPFCCSDINDESKKLRVLLHGRVADRINGSYEASAETRVVVVVPLVRKPETIVSLLNGGGDGRRGLGVYKGKVLNAVGEVALWPFIKLKRS